MKKIWPFTLFKKKKTFTDERYDPIHGDRFPWEEIKDFEEEEEETVDRVLLEANRLALKEYNEAIKEQQIKPCIITETRLASAVHATEENDFIKNCFTYFHKIKLENNWELSLKVIKGGTRNFRKVFVGDQTKKHEINLREDLYVEDSLEGVWQVFIFKSYIDKLSSIGLYYVFSKENLKDIKTFRNEDLFDALNMFDTKPYIGKFNNKYYISYCFFSQWEGLIRQIVQVSIFNNHVSSYRIIHGETLYKYDCGFMI